MIFTVYKTTCLSTGKYYYGVHETDDMYDAYFGSGIWIKRALKKHGKKAFHKDILFTYLAGAEAYAKEVEMIKDAINDPLCMNFQEGGRGGFKYINENGLCDYVKSARAGGKKASESGQAAEAAAIGRKRMMENGMQKQKGCKLGRRNVESGFLASLRTHDHQVAAARASGKKAALSGRIQKLGHQYGGKFLTSELGAKGGRVAGRIAAETGQAASLTHIRWHVNRNIINEKCELCVGAK